MMMVNDDAREASPGIIKLIGIGQSLRGDDGAGLAAVRLWQITYPDKILPFYLQVELAELPGIGLLSLLEGASFAILLDAVSSGATPGTIYLLDESHLETFSQSAGTAHGWGVAETLALGRQLMPNSLPRQIKIIGIEAGQLNPGEGLSPAVEAAIPEVCKLINRLLDEYLHNS